MMFSGKDITTKLYSVSEGLSGAAAIERDAGASHLTRSASVDAVHEGTRGKLRSLDWRTGTQRSQGRKGILLIFPKLQFLLC